MRLTLGPGEGKEREAGSGNMAISEAYFRLQNKVSAEYPLMVERRANSMGMGAKAGRF
jgi:hypothetical protein